MRIDLRAKVTITITIFLVAMLGIVMYLSVTKNLQQLHTSLNEQSKSFASLATPPIGNTFVLYQNSGSIKITQQVNKFLELDPDVDAIGIVSVDGKTLYNSNSQKMTVSETAASSFTPKYVTNEAGFISEIIQPFFEDSGAHRYSVVYTISTRRIEQNVASSVRLIVYVGIIILIVSIAATSWALNRLFVRPLREVSRSADIISGGDYSQQIVTHADSHDEIGQLAQAVNRMSEALKADIGKLRELDKMKSEFMMIASHNLRTPLTVMRGYMDMAKDAQTVQELKSIVDSVQESVTRLHLLSEDLLTISSLESGGEKMQKTPAVARHFIDSMVQEFELLANKKKLRWQYVNELPEDLKINISQANMRSALGNLIDNAIKFTKEGGSVRITAKAQGGRLIFAVSDTGIGIREEEVPRLFTKFHRGTSTLTYDYEGAGVGLYLTKLIVGEHGGQITVESKVDHGSIFTVYLPLA
jgi:signal transduction histidine kinase